MKTCYLIFCLSNLFTVITYTKSVIAQGINGGIEVAVYKSANNPVTNASIRVYNFSGGMGAGRTDINGTSTIAALPPGRYNVQFAVEGYPTIIYEAVLVQPGTKTKLSYSFNEQTTIRDTIRIEYVPPRPKKTTLRIHSRPH